MDQNTVWVIAIAALIIGTLMGFMFGRSGSNGSREVRLAEELDRAQLDLARYREEVNEHFTKTAELVNGLSTQYQRVHQHLAESAQQLCRDEKLVASLKSSATPRLTEQQAPATTVQEVASEDESVSAPLDYAPKRASNEPGTLSDRFGLHSEDQISTPADPSSVNPENPAEQTENTQRA